MANRNLDNSKEVTRLLGANFHAGSSKAPLQLLQLKGER